MPTFTSDALTLKPSQRRTSQFILLSVLAVIFDAVEVGVVWQTFAGHTTACFAVFFALAWGLFCALITLGAIRAFLVLFNPMPTLTLARGALSPGLSTELKWRFDGRYDRIGKLTVTLEGRERATYRQGTSTRTDTNVFARVSIFETERGDQMFEGKCNLRIPAGAMHTFRAPRNEIRWYVVVHGDIAGWPDVDESFDIEIQPAPISGMQTAVVTPFALEAPGWGAVIQLSDNQTSVAPGQPIMGMIAWSSKSLPKSVEVCLRWSTSGKGSTDNADVQRFAVPNPQQKDSQHFSIPAPNGPHSFSGKLISLTWNVVPMIDGKPDGSGIDIVCAPQAREIILTSAQPAATL